eukprot:3157985-Rhodomonas_salina.2
MDGEAKVKVQQLLVEAFACPRQAAVHAGVRFRLRAARRRPHGLLQHEQQQFDQREHGIQQVGQEDVH